MTFRLNGRPVHGCTKVRLGKARSVRVTCKLHHGFRKPGYRLVSVTYSGGKRYKKARTTSLEDVVPRWHGLWLVSPTGRLTREDGARPLPHGRMGERVVAAAMPPTAGGLWLLTRAGNVRALGTTHTYGSGPKKGRPFVAMAPTRDGHGYWLLSASGALWAFGNARHLRGAHASRRSGRFVAMAATPDGRGCWLLSSRGTVVARGDAHTYRPRPHGYSPAGPYVGLVPSANGRGYTLLTASGRLVAFGDEPAWPTHPIAKARLGFVAVLRAGSKHGLWLVTRTGAVIPAGHAPRPARHGRLRRPVVAAAGT